MSTGAAWASTVLINCKHTVSHRSSHSCQNSDIQKSSQTVSHRQKSSCTWCSQKVPMMENPPCEIIQQQSQRYSCQSSGGAARMVQTIRNQIKACKIQIEKNSGTTIKVDSPLLTWLPRHAAWQYKRFHKRQDSATTAYEKRVDTCLTKSQSYSLEGQLRAEDHWSTTWNQHGSKVCGSGVTAKQMFT